MQGGGDLAAVWGLCPSLPLQEDMVNLWVNPRATCDSQTLGPKSRPALWASVQALVAWLRAPATHRPHLHGGITVSGTAILQALDSAGVDTFAYEECLEESQRGRASQSAL